MSLISCWLVRFALSRIKFFAATLKAPSSFFTLTPTKHHRISSIRNEIIKYEREICTFTRSDSAADEQITCDGIHAAEMIILQDLRAIRLMQ